METIIAVKGGGSYNYMKSVALLMTLTLTTFIVNSNIAVGNTLSDECLFVAQYTNLRCTFMIPTIITTDNG